MPKTKNRDIRVLVVDEEPMMSDSLRQHLAEEGYAVDTAARGAEAIDPDRVHRQQGAGTLRRRLQPRVDLRSAEHGAVSDPRR